MFSKFFASIMVGSLLMMGSAAFASGQNYWQSKANEIAILMDKTVDLYKVGDKDKAKRTVIEAYFGVFEDSKMEAAMRQQIGAKHTFQVEKLYGNLRKLIKKGVPLSEVQALCDNIKTSMSRDAKVLDDAGVPAEVFKVNQ